MSTCSGNTQAIDDDGNIVDMKNVATVRPFAAKLWRGETMDADQLKSLAIRSTFSDSLTQSPIVA
jgi:hypothetical protein